MIKTIIFDLGQVLLLQKKIEMGFYISRIFNIPLSYATKLYSIRKRNLVTGKITSKILLSEIKEITNSQKPIGELLKEYRDQYRDYYIGVNIRLLNYADRLRNIYDLFIFTNTIDVHDKIAMKLGIYEHFKHIFKSYTDHIIKPEKESYLYILNKIKAKPEECIFIDDLKENIKGAKKVGMKGIIYKNIDQFKKDLSKFGVKI